MSFWEGFLRGYQLSSEKKQRREEFEQAMLAKYKEIVLPQLMDLRTTSNEAQRERSNRIKDGITLGLSQETAVALEASGELPSILEIPRKDLDPSQVRDLDDAIRVSLSERLGIEQDDPAALAAALRPAIESLSGGESIEVAYTEGLFGILAARDPDEIFRLATKTQDELTQTDNLARLRIDGPYGVNIGALQEDTFELFKDYRKLAGQELAEQFGFGITVGPTGEIEVYGQTQGKKPEEFAAFNKLLDTVANTAIKNRTVTGGSASSLEAYREAIRPFNELKMSDPSLSPAELLSGVLAPADSMTTGGITSAPPPVEEPIATAPVETPSVENPLQATAPGLAEEIASEATPEALMPSDRGADSSGLPRADANLFED